MKTQAMESSDFLPPPSNTQNGKSNLVGWRAGGWKKLINKLSVLVKTADGKLILVGNDEVLSRGNRTETSDSKVAVDFGRMTAGQFGRIHMFVAQTGTEVCSVDQSCIIDFTARVLEMSPISSLTIGGNLCAAYCSSFS